MREIITKIIKLLEAGFMFSSHVLKVVFLSIFVVVVVVCFLCKLG